MKERAYPKKLAQEGDAERYGELKSRIDVTIFAASDKVEMRKAKILWVASSDFLHTSKFFFWPDVIMLAGTDLDWMQSTSMAIGVQRQTELNPTTILLAVINDHLHSRGLLSRLREPATAEDAVWPAIKDNLGEIMDVLKEAGSRKKNAKASVCVIPRICTPPGWTKNCVCNDSVTLRREI